MTMPAPKQKKFLIMRSNRADAGKIFRVYNREVNHVFLMSKERYERFLDIINFDDIEFECDLVDEFGIPWDHQVGESTQERVDRKWNKFLRYLFLGFILFFLVTMLSIGLGLYVGANNVKQLEELKQQKQELNRPQKSIWL